jgi:thiol-disulfide isomerase/thioredoxin
MSRIESPPRDPGSRWPPGSRICKGAGYAVFSAALFLGAVTVADEPTPGRAGSGPESDALARIEADYQAQRAQIDRERIERLARLAHSQTGRDAELTYLEILRFAIAADRYAAAETVAERVIRAGTMNPEVEFLAQLVNIIAEAERGDYDQSMRDLKTYVAGRGASPAPPAQNLSSRTVLAIGEAYFRRLVQGRRFDLAREVCDLIIAKSDDPAIRDHFAAYWRRLQLVGRPAPAIRGTDADGNTVALDRLKGKAVLVVFWATWCTPCVERLPLTKRALELYESKGFAVLGVNLDKDADRRQVVRRFVVDFGIPWPNVVNGEGVEDVAATYAIAEIPANVLIGRDGNVATFDVSASELLQTVSQAVAP